MKKLIGFQRLFVAVLLLLLSNLSHAATPLVKHSQSPSTYGPIPGQMGDDGGPVQTNPQVYVVFWGWQSDPYGAESYLINYLNAVGGSAWLNTVTEYGGGNPQNILKGVWYDNSAPYGSSLTTVEIQNEAMTAASHFGVLTSNNVNTTILVATGPGLDIQTYDGVQWCAYHSNLIGTSYPNVTYIRLPYLPDFPSVCGAYSVSGILDSVSIVTGHELAETITDPLGNAWLDANGLEIADKCEMYDLSAGPDSFPVQPLWSNKLNMCAPIPPPNVSVPPTPGNTSVSWYPGYPSGWRASWSDSAGVQYYVVTSTATTEWVYTTYAQEVSSLYGYQNMPETVQACNSAGCSAPANL